MREFVIVWDRLAFAVRWLHVITATATAWIGSSFRFVALDPGPRKAPDLPPGACGEGWQVHGGGSYPTRKHLVAPEPLSWFKWRTTSPGSRASRCCASHAGKPALSWAWLATALILIFIMWLHAPGQRLRDATAGAPDDRRLVRARGFRRIVNLVALGCFPREGPHPRCSQDIGRPSGGPGAYQVCEVKVTNGGKTGSRPLTAETPPHPFEDLAAPPLRLRPHLEPRRVVPFPQPQPERAAPLVEADEPMVAEKAPPRGPEAIRALPHQPKPSGSRHEVGLALLVGFAIAAAIVAAAVFFRPEPTATALGSGPLPEQGLEVAATPISDVVVQVRLPASTTADRVDELRGALAAAGFVRVEVETLTTPIGAARVDYAHPQDQAAAETLAGALSPLAGGGLVARQSAPAPGLSMGRIDLWIVR